MSLVVDAGRVPKGRHHPTAGGRNQRATQVFLVSAQRSGTHMHVRNSLYFEMSLDERSDTMLVSYDRFLADPWSAAHAMCSFLGLEFGPHLIAHVRPRPSAWPEPISIDDQIRERCEALQTQLDAASLAAMAEPSRS